MPTKTAKTRARTPKPAEGSLLNSVARSVGSTLGTIVAKTESAMGKPAEMLEDLKARASEIKRQATRKTASPRKKTAPARKKAAPAKRTSAKAKARKRSR
jgi:hypothetical protein